MTAPCPNCGETNPTTHQPFAENVTCWKCKALWRTPETAAIRHGDPRVRLDFEDWRQLCEALSPAALNSVLRLAGLALAPDGRMQDESGGPISMEEAHVRVQENAEAQSALYQHAMGLWR